MADYRLYLRNDADRIFAWQATDRGNMEGESERENLSKLHHKSTTYSSRSSFL